MRSKVPKRFLSLMLALTMVLSLAPVAAFADGDGSQAQPDTSTVEPAEETPNEGGDSSAANPKSEEKEEEETPTDEGEPSEEEKQGEDPQDEDPVAPQADAEEPVAEAAETIEYTEKSGNGKQLTSNSFLRIVHIDCGRKYFSVADLKKIIDAASENHYTHVELAFGNDGLRFLLNNMSLTVNGTTYASDAVKSAIQQGNKSFYDAGTNELTQSQMDTIIAYAKNKGIGIIPMFDAPGHLQAVIRAMGTLGIPMEENVNYIHATNSSSSQNWAVLPTDAAGVNFVQALMQKYIDYFKGKTTLFNIAGDECGFEKSKVSIWGGMNNEQYTAYAKLVNSLAAKVQNAGMMAMAFNDGIYHKNLTTSTDFDTNIAVCYWDASSDKYASAADLNNKGFQIINTNNRWYYVIGKENITGNNWGDYAYTCEYAKQQMAKEDCLTIDGDSKKTTPVGCMAAIWCDTPSNNVTWDNVTSYISTFATSNPEYFVASGESGDKEPDEGDTATEENITLFVGESKTKIQEGVDNTQKVDKANLNEEIAAVSAKYEQKDGESVVRAVTNITNNTAYYIQSADEKKYLNANAVWVDDVSQAVQWKVSSNGNGYRLANNSKYLRYNYGWTTTTRSNNATTLHFNEGTFYGTYSWNGGYSNPLGSPVTVSETDPVNQTTITFTGVAEGTTKVKVGNVIYNIQVIAEDLSNVSALPIQLWITNNSIEADKTTTEDYYEPSWNHTTKRGASYVELKAVDAYGEAGKTISDLLPNNIKRYENDGTYYKKEQQGKTATELVVWDGRVHKNGSSVQLIYNKDYSNTGTEFRYVRYYNGQWAVSADRNEWTQVTGRNSISGEQLAVYYMMRSEITKEVTTDVADWGYVKSDSQYSSLINAESYVMLDFAVKYQNGTRVPDSFPQDGKTFVFHCNANDSSGAVVGTSATRYRQLNNFRAVNTSDYEVYMVTVTMTNDSASTTISNTASYSYDGEEQIVWAIDQNAKDASGLEEYKAITSGDKTYSGCTIGGDPYVRGVEVYNQHGALITYYVRAKAQEDSLKVHYIDKTSNNYEFHSYYINVIRGTTFDKQIGLANPWKGNLANGSVENKLSVIETVSADLATMPEIGAQYRFGNYKCVQVTRSDDGKDVYLYYTFTYSATFVVDFGLPLKIAPKDVYDGLKDANITKAVAGSRTHYADVSVDDSYNIIYKLNKAISSSDTIAVTYTGKNLTTTKEGSVTYNIEIIPATTVYYEDSFVTFHAGTGAASKAIWSEVGTRNTDATQALEELGNKQNVYGYDSAYDNSTTFSMGSAQKVTVKSEMAASWNDDTSKWPTATFTFQGTGFDVISLTDNTSGAITVKVYDKDNKRVKSSIVDNYYGYIKNDAGEWVVDENAKDALYQIPVMKITGLEYGEYKVVITVLYDGLFDHQKKSEYNFWLDAIRVYDPMDKDNPTYKQDNEGYPQYIKLRDSLAKDNTAKADVVFIDGGDTADIATYANYGPNNEVYLAKGQAISFKIPSNEKLATVQIGAKAPQGESKSAEMSVKVGANEAKETALDTATEMYYKIEANGGDTIVISNTSEDGILSLTNLKLTFTEQQDAVTLETMDNTEQTNAVMAVRALFAAPPVTKTFEPARLEASWSKNVKAGKKATLTIKTSEDVEAVTVDGETVDTYRTRTERTGWLWNSKKVTYREFTYTVTAKESKDYTITALDAEGTASEAITATLTVKSSNSWWDRITGWF